MKNHSDYATEILQAVIAASPMAVAVIDLEGKVLLWSPVAEKMFGWTADEVQGQLLPIVPPDKMAEFKANMANILQGQGHRQLETERYRKDSSRMQVMLTTAPIQSQSGEIIGAIGTYTDITEQKQAQDELKRQKERLQTIIDNIPVMISFFDEQGKFVLVNREWERVLGWDIEAMNDHPDILAEFYPDPEYRQAALEYMISAEPGWREFKTRTRNGQVIDTVWANVRLADGTSIGIGQDVTMQKKLTERYRQAQKMEAVGRLAGGIAHDFNNLLVPIIGYVELSMLELRSESKLYGNLAEVQKAAERATELTRQILAFSRQQVMDMEVLNLNTVIMNIQKIIERLMREDIDFQVVLDPDLYLTRVDRSQIEQIVLNLVINARDAMPDGGKLTLETANAQLDEAYLKKYAEMQTPGDYVMLAVSDTGHGMDEKTLDQIFEPFFTTKDHSQGTGLGLSTVYGIVNQHQGHIWVYSEPGRGAIFKIYLPRTTDTVRKIEKRPIDTAPLRGTETIMVVEDEAMVRELVSKTLAGFGYQVLEAQTPAAGLQLAANHPGTIDLLITDVILPGMNGRELYQQFNIVRPDTKVLYMSGYTKNVIVHHGVLDEGLNFLQKPFSPHTLISKVREVLG